jgi:hypothetical protein
LLLGVRGARVLAFINELLTQDTRIDKTCAA